MIGDYFTVREVAEILNIYEISAKELLNGTIQFESEELMELAVYKGLNVDMFFESTPA